VILPGSLIAAHKVEQTWPIPRHGVVLKTSPYGDVQSVIVCQDLCAMPTSVTAYGYWTVTSEPFWLVRKTRVIPAFFESSA
jgi:hypothetical protein